MNKSIIATALSIILFSTAFGQDDERFSDGIALSFKHADDGPAAPRFNNAKVERSFFSHFTGVKEVVWKETADNFIANFKKDGNLAIAWFTKSGRLYCTNHYGGAAILPESETALLHDACSGYQIIAVVQVVKSGKTAYIVTLKNLEHYRKIKMVDGEYEELETLTSADANK